MPQPAMDSSALSRSRSVRSAAYGASGTTPRSAIPSRHKCVMVAASTSERPSAARGVAQCSATCARNASTRACRLRRPPLPPPPRPASASSRAANASTRSCTVTTQSRIVSCHGTSSQPRSAASIATRSLGRRPFWRTAAAVSDGRRLHSAAMACGESPMRLLVTSSAVSAVRLSMPVPSSVVSLFSAMSSSRSAEKRDSVGSIACRSPQCRRLRSCSTEAGSYCD
mmetsp:Transcript_21443/g.75474  ORF Transcript_21443/g.75474 Transcript_21443/m.75474 type:complete len:226 (-) Transcript_21443:2-679(-)